MNNRKEHRPRHVFKYLSLDERSIEFTRQALVSQKLYYQSPLKFNDPFDCSPVHDASGVTPARLQRRLVESLSRRGLPADQVKKLTQEDLVKYLQKLQEPSTRRAQNQLLREAVGTIGVLCLSSRGKHSLMWAHYASKHQGISLCFDGRHEYFEKLHRVHYSPLRPKICGLQDPADDEAQQERMQQALCVKHDVWRYEDEWRDFRFPTDAGSEAVRVQTYPLPALKGVLLGADIGNNQRKQVAEWLAEAAPNIHVWQLHLDNLSFALKAERVRLTKTDSWSFVSA
ncbi:DUF2971 domain-containing protein [Paucibacter sp. Y2R2-4]|uniref:DUF2971 domain-containing protein n=1 Tax=Paucibacter sp. Y2R2-4 TaxID=2893553 RepID=UPI0021E3B900|nr:DUF2971 domain-containing protein [Paucibacter sp. Y2R2-4]MCV2348705.1 DUF2971 domain-containing protein [Paucibacter sp. Y2R2-4]